MDNWFYVKSAENPADLVSRGCVREELQDNSLWWNVRTGYPTGKERYRI